VSCLLFIEFAAEGLFLLRIVRPVNVPAQARSEGIGSRFRSRFPRVVSMAAGFCPESSVSCSIFLPQQVLVH
jgi:hypothetical protein